MFHKNLDQASKRYNKHPNVAVRYTSLPKDKANRPERQHYLPKVRDFAYDQHDSNLTTRDFIADFTDFGFRSYHRRVYNGDLLSRAGVLAYQKLIPRRRLPEPSAELKARFPGFFDFPPRSQALSTPKNTITVPVSSAFSHLSGTTATPSIVTSGTTESPQEDRRRSRDFRVNPLMLAVAVCMLENMK